MKDHPKGNAEYINHLNKVKVLNIIRENEIISRADIVKKTGISAPTVTRAVESLINKERLVFEEGIGSSKGGRPPVMVKFNGEQNYVIGIDWGRTHINGTIANLNAQPLITIDKQTDSKGDFSSDRDKVVSMIDNLIKNSGIDQKYVRGIGIAAAGYYNIKRQVIEYSPNFNWHNVDIKSSIEQLFHVPITVDNVSRAMALGELWYGLGKTIKDFMFVNLGYGLGAGIISNGQPFYGFEGISGEIGHTLTPLPTDLTIQCVCGKENCLECFGSGRGLKAITLRRLSEYPNSSILTLAGNDASKINAKLLAKAAKQGDRLACKVFEESALHLGTALANFANILNPEAIVLGGMVARAGEFYLDGIGKAFHNKLLKSVARTIPLLQSRLGKEAAVKGAIALILKEVLSLNKTK